MSAIMDDSGTGAVPDGVGDGQKSKRRKRPGPASERCAVEQAAAIIGLPLRTVQNMAARGEIPGAAKFGRWTFDILKLRKLVEDRERASWLSADQKRHPVATGVRIVSGAEFGRRAVPQAGSVSRYEQAIQQLRGSGSKRPKSS